MFSLQCSSGHRNTSFLVIAILLNFLLLAKQYEGQLVPVYMYPNTDDQVLEAGTTLNLTCICTLDYRKHLKEMQIIEWKLPDFFTKIDTVQKSFPSL